MKSNFDFSSPFWAQLSLSHRNQVQAKLAAVRVLLAAPYGQMAPLVRAIAKRERVAPSTVNRWLANFRRHGVKGLIDTRIACPPQRSL